MSNAKFRRDIIEATTRIGILEGMRATVVGAGRIVRKTLSRPGTGTLYRVAQGKAKGRNLRARGYHRASLPGSPPAVNTNRLRASWSVEQIGGGTTDSISEIRVNGPTTVLRFGSNVPYARLLEFGTRRMKKRPYIAPSMRPIADTSLKLLAAGIRKALREAR
jgi:hypothetical protein